MFTWLKALFTSMDRQSAAADRAAKAAEDVADMLEAVRDQLRERLGAAPEPKALEAASENEAKPRGRSR